MNEISSRGRKRKPGFQGPSEDKSFEFSVWLMTGNETEKVLCLKIRSVLVWEWEYVSKEHAGRKGDVVLDCCCSPMETTLKDDPRQPFSILSVNRKPGTCWRLSVEKAMQKTLLLIWWGCICVPTHSMEEGRELCSSTGTVACVPVCVSLERHGSFWVNAGWQRVREGSGS